jgi:hypothetical protein
MLQYKDHEAEGELQKALQERELAGESNSMEVVPERVGNAENPTSVGRPTKPIVLSEDERAKLQEWARRPKTAQRSALRARIVLSCAEGIENRTVARQLRITDQTVCKWRERFRIARLVACRSEFLSTSEPTLHAKSSGQGASWRFRDLHVAKVFPATGH